MCVTRAGSRMRQPRRGNDSSRKTRFLGVFEQRLRLIALNCPVIVVHDVLIHGQNVCVGFYARNDRAHRRRRIGRLLVGRVSFRECRIWKILEAKAIFLAAFTAKLAFEDPRSGKRGNAHSVADEQNDVHLLALLRQDRLCRFCTIDGRPAVTFPGFCRFGPLYGKRLFRHLCGKKR